MPESFESTLTRVSGRSRLPVSVPSASRRFSTRSRLRGSPRGRWGISERCSARPYGPPEDLAQDRGALVIRERGGSGGCIGPTRMPRLDQGPGRHCRHVADIDVGRPRSSAGRDLDLVAIADVRRVGGREVLHEVGGPDERPVEPDSRAAISRAIRWLRPKLSPTSPKPTR